MAISKKVFDALREAKVSDSIIDEITKENEALNKFEGDERQLEKIKKQLGEHKIEDLISAKTALDSFGGVDKVKALEVSVATTEAEKKALADKHENLNKELQTVKSNTESLNKELERAQVKAKVTAKLYERFGSNADDVFELEGKNITLENGVLFYDKQPFDTTGIEALVTKKKNLVATVQGSGTGVNPPNGDPTPPQPKKILFK